MGKVFRIVTSLALAVGLIFGGYFLWDWASRVPASDLETVVRRDAVAFEIGSVPDEVIDRLASNRVVILGETHFLNEHTELTAELLRKLHARGFRQFLFEWTQAADWALADYVNDGGLLPDWTVPDQLWAPIVEIREFNRSIPAGERIEVHAIDIHLDDYGGTTSWLSYVEFLGRNVLPDPGPLADFLEADHDTLDDHQQQLEVLLARLEDGQIALSAAWGDYWYSTVREMVEVELRSAPIRALREVDYEEHARLREETIKWLADRRIASTAGGTLINFGSTHAQKEGLWGTEGIEWLGDYLSGNSPVTDGSVIVIWVPAAHIVAAPGDEYPDFYLATASPENELLRVMEQTWPDRFVFQPLDDPLFSQGRIVINSSGDIYVAKPKRHYDAILLLPQAQRDYLGNW